MESVKCKQTLAQEKSSSVKGNSGKVLLSQIRVKDNFLRCSLLLIEGFLHTFEVELLDPRESGGNWEIIVGTGTQGKQGLLQMTSSSVSSTLTYTLILQN